MLPKITVVTVVYNGILTLDATIKSVISQTYSNLEYIVVDGGSTDGTLELLKKYNSQISIIISEKDDVIIVTGKQIGRASCRERVFRAV